MYLHQSGYKFVHFKMWLVLAILLGLTGCGRLSRIDLREPLSQENVIGPNSGVLVVRIVNAGTVLLPFNYITVVPENYNATDSAKAIRLTAIGGRVGDSSLFISSIPAGKYSVRSIRSLYYSPEGRYSDKVKADINLGTFTVQANKTTDLGVLIYYPQSQGDSIQHTLVRSPESGNSDLIGEFAPFAGYQQENALGWTEDGKEVERFTRYAFVVRNPVVYNKRFISKDNSIYFIGKLGYLVQRTEDGRWLEDAVETDADLIAMAENSDGDIAVGGELGALFLKRTGTWQRVPLDKNLTVQDLFFTDSGSLDVIAWNRAGMQVMRIDPEQPEQHKIMAGYNPDKGWYDTQGVWLDPPKRQRIATRSLRTLYTQYINNRHYIFITDSRRAPSEHNPLEPRALKYAYRFFPEDWSLQKFNHFGDGVDRIFAAGAVNLGIKEPDYFSWSQDYQYFRYDPGKWQWIQIRRVIKPGDDKEKNNTQYPSLPEENALGSRTFEFMGIPVFFSQEEAVAIVSIETFSKKPLLAVARTNDGGKMWTVESFDLPGKYCSNTIPEVKGTLLVSCNGLSNDFYESNDKGVTWKHVRQSENF